MNPGHNHLPYHNHGLESGCVLQQQPREQPQKTAPAANLEASSLGFPLISLQQSTLVLTKQTEEIYACLSLRRAPHSLLNESSSFRDHSHWDREDVCFAPKQELWSCLSPSFLGWRGRQRAWREPLNLRPGALLRPLTSSSLSSSVNTLKLSQWGHLLLNSSGKVQP